MSRFNLSALAVRERAVTLFLIAAIAIAGALAFLRLGRAEDPTFTVKVLTVTTVWPGATAREMQDLVAEPLEKRLQELRWYDRVETMTRPGFAFMTLTLKDSMPPAEVPDEFYQARKKLGDEARNLPVGAIGPFVNDEYSDVVFGLYALKAPGMAPRLLARQAEEIRQRLLHVPGVKKVNILGERPEKIFVEFSYPRLVTLGISPQEVFTALQGQNAVTPAGSIDADGPQVFIRLDGAYDDIQKIADTPIVAGGRSLKLSDIAGIKRGYEDPATYLIRHQGEPALMLSVIMQTGWNGLDLGKALEAETARIGAGLPLGIGLEKVTDQAVNITQAVDEFMLKFFIALGVVLVVSLVSLGWRVGIVVAAAVPLTLAVVFLIMLDTGRAFDRISLGALILALGLLVDDAIIAIEIMVVKMEEGMDRIAAAAYAWSHTAAPMLSGTLVTVIGLMPVGFAKSGAGEYAGNIFWIVGFALIASWFVAVAFTPYLGVKLLPVIKPVPGGHAAIYDSPRYRRLRGIIAWSVRHKFLVVASVVGLFLASGMGMGALKKQFFPTSDRPELLVEVQMPEGTSIEMTQAAAARVEAWVRQQPEAKVVSTYIGQGAPRFFLAYNPELPDPSFAKMVILTPDAEAREALKVRLRHEIAQGLAPQARVRVTQLVFGPYSPYPVAFRIMGPDPVTLRALADRVEQVMLANADTRQVSQDWGQRTPTLRFVPDQDRLRLIGLSPVEVAQQLQFLLTGVRVTQVREDIRAVDVIARSSGEGRLDPARLADFTLTSRDGRLIPLDQVGTARVEMEEPIIKRRDRTPTITVRADIDETRQPPEVSAAIMTALAPVVASLPAGYRIEMGGPIEEAGKANGALAAVFPVMLVLMMAVIMFQVRSFPAMAMVLLTAPLGLVGAVPVLMLFNQPFGFNAIIALIGLAGILMRNTLILIEQIRDNQAAGLDPYHAVVEATVQRARPVILTALAAVLAFIPLTHSVFWGSLAYTLIGGTALGTFLILLFLPALYAIWFQVRPATTKVTTVMETPDPATSPPRRLTGRLLAVLGGLAALGSLATNIMLPSLPGIATSFGVTTPDLGITLSAFFIVFALGQLVVGPLSDRLGRRPVIVTGIALFLAGTVICMMAGDLPTMVAGRIAQAAGVCATSVLARAIARDLFQGETLARAMSLTMVAMAAAPGFSPLLGGALDHAFGWRAAFVAVAVIGAIVGIAYLAILGESHPPARRAPLAPLLVARGYAGLAADRRFIAPALSVALVMGALFAIFTGSPAVLMDGLGLSAIDLGLFFAGTVFLVFGAGLAAPRLARRHGAERAAFAGLLIALLGGAAMLALSAAGIDGFAAYVASCSVFLFGMGLANPLGTAIALSPFGDRAGLASALLGFLQMAGAAAGAALATALPFTAMTNLGIVLAVFVALAVPIFLVPRLAKFTLDGGRGSIKIG